MSNSFGSNLSGHFVGPDLGLNCLQRLSADDSSRQRVKNIPLATVVVLSLNMNVSTVLCLYVPSMTETCLPSIAKFLKKKKNFFFHGNKEIMYQNVILTWI